MSLRQQNELTLNDSLCATENVSQEHYQAHTSLKGPLLKPSLTDAAKDFSIEQAVVAFGLKLDSEESGQVSYESGEVGSPKWPIEDIPETKGFVLTPYMKPLMENYSKNFERSSRAVRRTALDFILNECLTVLKGRHITSKGQATGSHAQRVPTPWDNVKIFGKVSFSHKITHPANGESVENFLGTVVNGTVDRGIGRALPYSRHDIPARGQPTRRFQSLLLFVEAKAMFNIDDALPQLVVYLASIHQSRLQRNRPNATVYGTISDGYTFIFVTITHDGVLKQSRRFEVLEGEITTVLGCLKYLIETSASISPSATPEKDGDELDGDHYDGERVEDHSCGGPVQDHSDFEPEQDYSDAESE